MTYLLTQMFLYMLCAFLLGLFLGWWLWSRNNSAVDTGSEKRIKELEGELATCRSRSSDLQSQLATAKASAVRATPAAVAAPVAAAPRAASSSAGTKPKGLDGPRGGKADDLKEISGVGPKLEKLLHSLGYYHFDQVGNWTSAEAAWVDDNLEGFKGRATRDKWIPQAKKLAKR